MKDPETARKEFLELCTACGLCAVMCPPFAHRTIREPLQEIQRQVRGYLGGGPPTDAVLERSRLCNECYKCVNDTCPQGLNPLRTNQLLRGLLNQEGTDPLPFTPPSDPVSDERVAAALLTTDEEFRRITTPSAAGDGRALFFPGCNIYYQPNLLLTAMDVLDYITDNWIFLPGLDHCCGSNYDSAGRLEAGRGSLERLCAAFDKGKFETVAVWCSTCAIRLRLKGFSGPVISFARLVADRLDNFFVSKSLTAGVTLHEPCKDAYLDMDTQGPREILKSVTGETVREMARHGQDTVCCGWALLKHRPETWERQMKRRLKEALDTGAGTLATVCHGCQWIMDRPGKDAGVRVVNYISLVGESLGIRHRERFSELRLMGSREAALESIRKEMGERFGKLPFQEGQIARSVEIIMGNFYGRGT